MAGKDNAIDAGHQPTERAKRIWRTPVVILSNPADDTSLTGNFGTEHTLVGSAPTTGHS